MGLYIVAVVAAVCAVLGALGGFVVARHHQGTEKAPTPFSKVLSVCVISLAVAFAFQLIYFQSEQRKKTDCQYGVNIALIDALNARDDASGEQQQKMIEMVAAIKTAKSAADTQVAMQAFLDAAEALKLKREQNPYPALPSDCR